MTTKIKALVPMKGNSERVQNKNMRMIAGRPLFHWILESLESSDYIDEIIINTDSDTIAEEANKYFSVTIHQRPDYLLGEMVTIQPLIEYDLNNSSGTVYLQTHSTNPLLKTETINRAIETYFSNAEHDTLFSVTPVQSRFYWENGLGINHDPANLLRTQDLKPIYEENSCIYIFSKATNLKIKNRIGLKPFLFPLDPLEAVDIDTMDDFIFAEYLLNNKYNLQDKLPQLS